MSVSFSLSFVRLQHFYLLLFSRHIAFIVVSKLNFLLLKFHVVVA